LVSGIYKRVIVNKPRFFLQSIARFKEDATRGKISDEVDFTQDLHLPVANNTVRKGYRAKAVILHRGASAAAGHYRALVREGEDQWILFDDSSQPSPRTTAQINSSEFRQQVYIILWEETGAEELLP